MLFKEIKNNYRVFVFQLGCTMIALALGAVIGTSLEFASYQNKFFKNISIGEVAIGNQSSAEAFAKVESHYLEDLQNTSLALNLDDSTLEIPVSKLVTDSNIDELIENAFIYSHTLSFMERYKLLTNKASKTFEVRFTYDDQAVRDYVSNFISLVSQPSSDASITVDTNGRITRTAEKPGVAINSETLTQAVYNLLTPQMCLSRSKTKQRSMAPFSLDAADFILPIEASITLESLENIDTCVASFSTSFTRGTGSDVNIAVAAKTINGTLLMPGEVFSYNDTIGNTTLDKGYTYATVIVNSQPAKGVGGGVCQVSTTLYNAILRIGLLPLERRPHSRPSTYVPLGLDAAIDWQSIDFKFKNTHDYPLYIVSYTTDNKVFVDLYSHKSLLNTTYKFNSEVLKTLPSTTTYINDSSLPPGTTQLVSKGTNGYQVKISRETYQNGSLSDSSVLYQDTYAAIPTVYKVGT